MDNSDSAQDDDLTDPFVVDRTKAYSYCSAPYNLIHRKGQEDSPPSYLAEAL